MSRSAIVVGGGIGGLAVAGGLTGAGWRVTVLERAPEFTEVGAGIVLEPNAVRALDWLGHAQRLRALSAAQGTAGLRSWRGRWLVRSKVDALQQRYGVPAYALHRAELLQLLLDAAAGAELRTGHLVTGMRQDADRATVTFEADGGGGALAADLVVAADGGRSAIRTAVLPAHPGLSYAGYVTWRAVVDAAAAAGAEIPAAVTESWGPGRRFGIVPLTDGRLYWFATASGPPGTGLGDDLAAIAARFDGWHDPVERVLAATKPDALLRHDIFSMGDPLPSYVHGRVVLVGDAAHAITPDLGQGAALAIEDAVVLTAELGRSPDDLSGALARYDAARRPRTQKLVRASAQVGRLGQRSNRPANAARDALISLVPTGVLLRISDDTFAWTPPSRSEGPDPRYWAPRRVLGHQVRTMIADLDPEHDDVEIVHLCLEVLTSPAVAHLGYVSAAVRTVAVPRVARRILRGGHGDQVVRPYLRDADTLTFFGELIRLGHRSPAGTAAAERVRQIHDTVGGVRNDDQIYTLGLLIFGQEVLTETLGGPARSAVEVAALFHFWTAVARNMRLHDLPETQDEYRAWMRDYETRNFAPSRECHEAAEAHLAGLDGTFPRPLRAFARATVVATMDQRVRECLGYDAPPAAVLATTRAVWLAITATTGIRPTRLDATLTKAFSRLGQHPDLDRIGLGTYEEGMGSPCRR